MTTPNAFPPPPAGFDTNSAPAYDAAPAQGYSAYPVATTPQPTYQNGPSGKTRSPIAVFLLGIISAAIYWIVWHYKVNNELKNFSPSIQVNPGLATLALFIPVANLVTIYNTGKRVQQAQAAAGMQPTCSPVVGLLLGWIIYGHTFYYQDSLNTIWQYRQA